jgi:hypothetical protein
MPRFLHNAGRISFPFPVQQGAGSNSKQKAKGALVSDERKACFNAVSYHFVVLRVSDSRSPICFKHHDLSVPPTAIQQEKKGLACYSFMTEAKNLGDTKRQAILYKIERKVLVSGHHCVWSVHSGSGLLAKFS